MAHSWVHLHIIRPLANPSRETRYFPKQITCTANTRYCYCMFSLRAPVGLILEALPLESQTSSKPRLLVPWLRCRCGVYVSKYILYRDDGEDPGRHEWTTVQYSSWGPTDGGFSGQLTVHVNWWRNSWFSVLVTQGLGWFQLHLQMWVAQDILKALTLLVA